MVIYFGSTQVNKMTRNDAVHLQISQFQTSSYTAGGPLHRLPQQRHEAHPPLPSYDRRRPVVGTTRVYSLLTGYRVVYCTVFRVTVTKRGPSMTVMCVMTLS